MPIAALSPRSGTVARVQGTVALITGASRGIGRATAVRLAAAGVDVVVNYHGRADSSQPDAIAETLALAANHGVRAIAIDADVSDPAAVSRMVSEAERELGRIDVLVSNAGIERAAPLGLTTDDAWGETLAVNLTGQFLVVKEVARGMCERRRGKIVTVASELALVGRAGSAAYCASKAGVIGLTKALARELAPDGILVNCVAPGPTDTDLLPASERTAELIAKIPLGRIGTPDEIASVIWFLVSPANTWMTGQVISPNGGAVI
jgi:NAD(P)-dependent dehydrogenase (short-subunit alcohol dehydrogenase family)